MPVVLLEGAVIAGRTYQADKRGGKIEARERLTEECVTSVAWFWGTQLINKGFDLLIGKKIEKETGLKDFSFDTGKDNVRNPFNHVTKGLSDKSKKLVSGLKFSKIIAAAAIASGVTGFVLPKINQKITTNMLDKTTNSNIETDTALNNTQNSQNKEKEQKKAQQPMDIQTFLAMARGEVGDPTKEQTPFKGGGAFFQTAAHQLENNSVAQLIANDTGLFTGRAVNARNKYERREILFRDLSSSFFYIASTPLIYNALTKIDSYKGKNTQLSPIVADKLDKEIREKFNGKDSISIKEFEKEIIGQQVVTDKVISDANNLFEGKEEKVTVDKIQKIIQEKVTDKSLAKDLQEKAAKLSKLQPKFDGKKIISKSQIHNLFHDGLLNDPKTIAILINDASEKKAMNPIKFISQKKIDKYKKQINNYTEAILEKAKKDKTGEISTKALDYMKNRNLITKLGYWGTGMAVSAYFLGDVIPKMQYAMTKKATGRDDFPGITKYN